MRVALWDLDNCLADDSWRINFINWSAADLDVRYHDYHRLCSGDTVCNLSRFFAVHNDNDIEPVFVTARPERVRTMTKSWIRSHITGTFPDDAMLLMRGNRDHTPSLALKRELVHGLRTRDWGDSGLQIVTAFDDRPDIVAMYREQFGIDAHVLAIHSVCAYTPPQRKSA